MPALRPPFARFPILPTRRLTLRALVPDDVPQILTISRFKGEVARALADAYCMQERIWEQYYAGTLVHWGYALTDEPGVIVGTGGFYRGFPDNVGEIGYILLPAYYGQGYATEAAQAMVQFGFEQLGLDRVNAFTDPTNVASAAVLRRAGFREIASERLAESRHFVSERPIR